MPEDRNREKLVDLNSLQHVKTTLDAMRQKEDAVEHQENAMRRQAVAIGFLCTALAVTVVVIVMLARPGRSTVPGSAPAPRLAESGHGAVSASSPPHQPVPASGPDTAQQNISVTLTKTPDIPPGPTATGPLEGKVVGLSDPSAYRAVIYSHAAGEYYVQPTIANPLTQISSDGSFQADVYGAEDEYYVLIVKYNDATPPNPPGTTSSLDGLPGVVARGHAKKGVGQ